MAVFFNRAVMLSILAFVAACTSPAPQGADPHAVQATAAGKAICLATSAQVNQGGADATNAVRRRTGLAPVQPNTLLAQVAAAHACDMANRGRMTHIGSTTSGPGSRVKAQGYRPMVTAENIAAGPFTLPRVLNEWNASDGHMANISIPQVRDYGIGQAIAADGRTRFWAAIYAAPR